MTGPVTGRSQRPGGPLRPGRPGPLADLAALVSALEEQRNGEWRYLKFLQVTSLARGRHIHV